MQKTYRRVLLFVSVVAFLGLTPVLLLYALGYRLDSSSVDPLPVGVVLVETFPSRADIAVDGTSIGRSPESIPDLPAGDVSITISKEGYKQWQKTISVVPGRALELRNIRLFPTDRQSTVLADDVSSFSLSPNRKLVAVVDSNRHLTIIDQTGVTVVQPVRLPASPEGILWSPNDAALLVTYPSSLPQLIEVGARPVPRQMSALRGAQDIVWDPRIAGRVLFRAADDSLQALNTINAAVAVLAIDVRTFATSDRAIFVVHADEQLKQYTLQGSPIAQTIPVPTEEVERLFVTPAGTMAYLTASGEGFIVTENGELASLGPALQLGWAPAGDMLYVVPDEYSLHVYNALAERSSLPLGQLQLITRLSRSISDPQWFAGSRHLLYQVEDELLITEIDTRDHPITYQVDTTNLGAAQAAVGLQGETLLYKRVDSDGNTQLVTTSLLDE